MVGNDIGVGLRITHNFVTCISAGAKVAIRLATMTAEVLGSRTMFSGASRAGTKILFPNNESSATSYF